MISVVDGGKGLGLGFGGREMEATEIEEGEACANQNDIDSTVDPDVALAYLDEKLEHVLGHFQKDFEGGVSAENLGSKFGGYGSFLPTYQRSPVWSHPKAPPKVQTHNASRSPTNLPLEGAHSNLVSSRGSLSVRHGSTPLGMATLPAPRVSSVDGCVKQEVVKPLTNFKNVSDNQSNQKTFKVRIKMGSDNLPTKKNADIYSGLGLDVSPTSSSVEALIDGESVCRLRNSPEVSPTSILEVMTSSPLHGSLLLSPLHDDLICLTDKEMIFQVNRSAPISHKGSQEGSLISVNGSKTRTSDKKFVGEKKPTSSQKVFTMELKNNNVKNNKNGVNVLLKKETDVDNSVCDELVSNALRLPLLSNSYHSVADSAKDTIGAANISTIVKKGGIKEESFDVAKDELHKSASIHENAFVGKSNSKSVSAMKASELKKTDSYDDEYGYPEKGDLKCEKIVVSSKVHTDMSKVRKGFAPEFIDHVKHISGQKSVSSVDDDTKVSSGKETSSSGSKRKSKKNQSHVTQVVTDSHNAKTKIDDISAPKSRKSANLNVCMSSSEVDDSKQGTGKAKDRYKEFFGDLELGDNDIADDIPSLDKSATCAEFEKGNGECTNVSKHRTTTKKIDQASSSEAHTGRSTSLVPPTGNRLISDAAAAAAAAPLVNENWVCCDKCQTWRLLPAGKDPDSLPKIWLCSMLDWLDGMNRCTFSEEETEKAVLAHHQTFASGLAPAPVYEGQSSHVDQSLQDIGGKKKHGFGDLSNASDQYGSSPYSNSKKKIPQASVKNRSLNGENRSTLNDVDFQVPGQSSGLFEQKRRHKRKEKSKTFANPDTGSVQSDTTGDIKSSKIRNKRENSQESYKASKKLKTSGVHIEGDRKSDNGVAALGVDRSSGSILSVNETGKHRHRNDLPKDLKVAVRNSDNGAQFPSDARLLHTENYIDGDVKRKINRCQETQLYTTPCSFEGNRLENHKDIMEEISENNQRKGKKQRVSKSGRNDSSMSKESGEIDKKGRSLNNRQEGVNLENNLFCRNLDAVDLAKKDVGSTQPPVAATSSSSKVSGSHKSKANLQEVKFSPVESVSSSPLRISNQDILLSTRRDHGGKNDCKETVILAPSSPRKCSDGEDSTGIDQSRMIQKNLTINTMNHGSVGSSMLDFQDKNQSNIPRTAMPEFVSSPEFATHVTDALQSDQYPCKPLISNDESGKKFQHHNSGSSCKSGEGSSSRCKDKSLGTISESENGNLKPSDLYGYADHSSHGQNLKARSKLQEKITSNSDKVEKTVFLNKDPVASPFTDIAKIEAQSSQVSLGSSDIRQVVSNHDSKQNLPVDCSSEKDSKRFPSDNQVDISGKGKSHSLPPSGRGQTEMTRWPQPINGIPKDGGVNVSTVSTSDGDTSKTTKQIKKSENQSGNGMMPINSQNPINSHKSRDIDAPSTIRKDSTSQAATNALKEAKDLKHLADRYKNSGSTLDSTGLYFQAALKFLYGASLLESCNSENAKHGEMIQSMQIYSDTAKLCEFCAHEYEKSKDMASAALAYKCVEVAYLRVINSARSSASKDRQELQTTLQIVLSGESPSSASDVDNLNNPAMVEKITSSKGVNSAQIAGNHVIPARNRPNFLRLLNFAQDVNFAMEASRKSRIAFTAAMSREDTKYRESMSSVKKALDFNFHDVEGLLLRVRLAMEAISR